MGWTTIHLDDNTYRRLMEWDRKLPTNKYRDYNATIAELLNEVERLEMLEILEEYD